VPTLVPPAGFAARWSGVLLNAEAAARELAVVSLEDSLALCLLMAKRAEARFERAATRWAGLAIAEHPGVGLARARDLVAAVDALRGSSPPTAGAQLAVLLRIAGAVGATTVVARFDD
jgi:hypothetical protein